MDGLSHTVRHVGAKARELLLCGCGDGDIVTNGEVVPDAACALEYGAIPLRYGRLFFYGGAKEKS
jgi:hypothetical protein